MSDQLPPNDHDLLITVDTKLEILIREVKELKDNTTKRVETLEHEKLDKAEAQRLLKEAEKLHNDHESRIRRLERYGSAAIGALALLEFLLRFYFR
jgi:hypothetical protein